ncbi:SAM-dependent methyltransferase [Elusimicrobiota bacterium]
MIVRYIKKKINRIKLLHSKGGFRNVVNEIVSLSPFAYYSSVMPRKSKTFRLRENTYKYCFHRYNNSWYNERTVEVPIIMNDVDKNKDKNILEVGNVLSHYYSFKHDIVDKYEKGANVINQDIVDYSPEKKYDLIISISTFEHVGWDEEEKNPNKIYNTVNHLKTLLSDNGKLLFTVPVGYNPVLDEQLFAKKLDSVDIYFLKRISKDNLWQETNLKEVQSTKFNDPYPNGNAIVVGIFKK